MSAQARGVAGEIEVHYHHDQYGVLAYVDIFVFGERQHTVLAPQVIDVDWWSGLNAAVVMCAERVANLAGTWRSE